MNSQIWKPSAQSWTVPDTLSPENWLLPFSGLVKAVGPASSPAAPDGPVPVLGDGSRVADDDGATPGAAADVIVDGIGERTVADLLPKSRPQLPAVGADSVPADA